MSEPESATKAPESDAEQISGITGDTMPDQGAASMGEHCVTDRPTPAGQTPTGEITKFNDVDVYVTKPADYPHSPSKLLLLLTGGTGIHSTNNQLQADKFAGEGFLVVMPDQFNGDPAPTTTTTAHDGSNASLLEQVKLGVASVAKSFTIDMWLARHTPEKVLPLLHKVITSVKEEFADAVAHGGGIYSVGYCFGAKYSLLLGADESKTPASESENTEGQAEEGSVRHGPQIKAAAIAHGTQITAEDMANNTAPICIVAVEQDSLFPDEIREAGVKAMQERKLDHEVKVYPSVPHGFAVLGDYEDSNIVEKQGEAFDQMLAWLKAH